MGKREKCGSMASVFLLPTMFLYSYQNEFHSVRHFCFVGLQTFSILKSLKRNLGFGRELTHSFLVTTQDVFVDSVDQDQTVQNVQSDL